MSPVIIHWAMKHQIPPHALDELRTIFGLSGQSSTDITGTSETAVQSAVRLAFAKTGGRLFRNNVGVLKDLRGVPVRYGLANDTPQLNKVLKSADLIGWRPVTITPQHVGTTIGQFISRECKKVGWHYTGNDHERAQLAWMQLVLAGGGDASFTTGIDIGGNNE